MDIRIGDKYYKREANDDSEDFRIVKMKNENTFVCKFTGGNTKKLSRCEIEDLCFDEYAKIKPDVIMTFSIVEVAVFENEKKEVEVIKDVMVGIYRTKDLDEKKNIPFAVCRQGIQDFFTTQINRNPYVQYVGLSMNQNNVPEGMDFMMLMACNKMLSSVAVAVYMEDTLDEILSFVNASKLDSVLTSLCTSAPDNIVGNYKTLRELLEANDIMYDFYSAFDIIKVPFDIKCIEDTDEIMPDQRKYIENQKKCEMLKTYVLEFARDFELSDIKRDYILLSDKNNKLYVMAYDKGGYVNDIYQKEFNDRRDLIAMAKQNRKLNLN